METYGPDAIELQTPGRPTTSTRTWRDRRARRRAEDRRVRWHFDRVVARVEPVAGAIVADFATSIVGRPVRRTNTPPLGSAIAECGVTWRVDGDVVLELLVGAPGVPSRLLVHEIALLRPIRKRLRTRHVVVEHRSR